MTADAQGLTRQFMELRSREVNLTADLAAREADEKTLEANMAGSSERANEIRTDLQSGEAKEQEARDQLAACQKELKKVLTSQKVVKKVYVVQEGDVLFIPAEILHKYQEYNSDSKRISFMIDCGEGTQLQLRRGHIHFSFINHIFISHLHGDHCFGLIGMISTFVCF